MCGRYTHLFSWGQLHRLMTLLDGPVDIPSRYNVAPTQDAPIIRADEAGMAGRHLEFMRWGLIPFWAKDATIAARTINARSETVASTPAYRAAFGSRRCLVPVSGFYEWQKLEDGKRKQPWYFFPAQGDDPLMFAGLWESWKTDGTAAPVRTFTVLTTTANALMAPIHHRMPVILESDQWDTWLDPAIEDKARLTPMLAPCPAERLRAYRVSTLVNMPVHEDPRCIVEVKGADTPAKPEKPQKKGRDEPGLFG